MNRTVCRWLLSAGIVLSFIWVIVCAQAQQGTTITVAFQNTSQGGAWPPSTIADGDGNFIVIGSVLTETAPGVIVPVPNQAALVSKETIPPLDKAGVEDFSNPFGAPYKVIRQLDLSPGSPDLSLVLFTNSFGPVMGNVGITGKSGPRIPMLGESKFNLNAALVSCPDLFPTSSQVGSFVRPRFPLHQVPINGFTGDQVSIDPDKGDFFDPRLTTGSSCAANCAGEDVIDVRRTPPITLGQYLQAQGTLTIEPTRFDAAQGAFTAARFDAQFQGLLPNAVYSVLEFRRNLVDPRPFTRQANLLGLPGTFMSDAKGNGRLSAEVVNPFPDPLLDDQHLRIISLGLAFHSDYQTWGACPSLLGPGVDLHAVMIVPPKDFTLGFSNLITKAPTGSATGARTRTR